MQGKIWMVTGANSGIGKAIAEGLAAQGATVVMVCREQATGQAALDEIKRASRSVTLELMIADLSSLASVRQLAAEYQRTHTALHGLINNAGVMRTDRAKTVDGYRDDFRRQPACAVSADALLLDTLKASAPARIINTYGNAGKIDFDDLMGERQYDSMKAYQQSKMANLLFTVELAKRLEGTGVTANAANPGFVRSNLGRDAQGAFKAFLLAARPTMRSPEKGAETAVYLASAPEVEKVSGKLFSDKRQSGMPSFSDAEVQRLWQVSAELTGLKV